MRLWLLPLFVALGCGGPAKQVDAPDDLSGEDSDMLDEDDIDDRSVDGTETDVDEDVELSDKDPARHDDAAGAEAVTPGVMKHTSQPKKPAPSDDDDDDDDPPKKKKKP